VDRVVAAEWRRAVSGERSGGEWCGDGMAASGGRRRRLGISPWSDLRARG